MTSSEMPNPLGLLGWLEALRDALERVTLPHAKRRQCALRARLGSIASLPRSSGVVPIEELEHRPVDELWISVLRLMARNWQDDQLCL